MAQKKLEAPIVLTGKMGKGFYQMKNELEKLSSAVGMVSDRIAAYEKESLEVYKNYETYMLEAKGALTTQYTSAAQLEKVMDGLDKAAQGWASSTIFHTNDVSKAISEAAHAGWDYDKMLSGIPSAMNLAQAGNIDLSTSLDYVIKSMNALGLDFTKSEDLIDQWTMAANSGATTVGELGQALTKMGATAKFADNTAELFTMLDVLANTGSVGTEAGTLLRNSMIRLVAPTSKASDAMEALQVSTEEYAEISGELANLKRANMLLDKAGFTVYDKQTGELRSMLDIYKDLYKATAGMTEKDRNNVLSAIFPTRSLTGGLALMESAANDFDGLYNRILDSQGYAAEIAEIQMSGLMGAEELFASKAEELQRKVGETLAPTFERILDFGGGILDLLNSIPKEQMELFLGAMNGIVSLGATSGVAAGLMKVTGLLGWQGMAITGVGAAIGLTVAAIDQMNQAEFEGHFGTMNADLTTLRTYVDGVKTGFDSTKESLETWQAAVDTYESDYANAASTFADKMLTATLTGKTLTQTEQDDLMKLGESMQKAVLSGINNAEARDLTFLDAIFGKREDKEGKETFKLGVFVESAMYSNTTEQAYEIGKELRKNLTKALEGDIPDEQERQVILDCIDRYNKIMAEISAQKDSEAYYTEMYKAQRVSGSSIAEYIAGNVANQNEELAGVNDLFANQYGTAMTAFDYALANGLEFEIGGQKRRITENDRDAFIAELEQSRADYEQGIRDKYLEFNFAGLTAAMMDSEYADAWQYLVDNFGLTANDIDWDDFAVNPVNGMRIIGESANAAMNGKEIHYWGNGIDHDFHERINASSRKEKEIADKEKRIAEIQKQIDANENKINTNTYDWNDGGGYSSVYAKLHGSKGYVGLYEQRERAEAELNALKEELKIIQHPVDITTPDAANMASDFSSDFQTGLDANPVHLTVDAVSSTSPTFATGDKKPDGFADGGYADHPSIFGEAGGEWAIPDRHDSNTLSLLRAAAASTGFGSAMSVGGSTVTISYAPVIYANDVSGLDSTLQRNSEDVRRLVEDALAESKRRDEAEVYV